MRTIRGLFIILTSAFLFNACESTGLKGAGEDEKDSGTDATAGADADSDTDSDADSDNDSDSDSDSDGGSNTCDPPCDPGEDCNEDNVCVCGDGPACEDDEECIDGECIGPCNDGVDNDGDGWTDDDDPDCPDDAEDGFGDTECNDNVDNDEDGFTDSEDPECDAAEGDEMLGTGGCVDVCVYGGEEDGTGRICELWQPSTGTWEEMDDGDGFLENRARLYNAWLQKYMEPAGGVMSAYYSDDTLSEVILYGNDRDSAIWTGTYLASESLRYMTDGHPEALEHVNRTVKVLHRWFNISGDPGYLARYVAPADSPEMIQKIFDPGEYENHRDVKFENEFWHWKGHTSRDQYQGPLLGYSLAYEATDDEDVREMIRDDVVELVEQLMSVQKQTIALSVINFLPTPLVLPAVELDFQYTVFAPSESSSNSPEIVIDVDDLEGITINGFQEFYPDLSAPLKQIPALSAMFPIPRASSSIMLNSFFLVALQVTEGVDNYEDRRDAIKTFYEANVGDWLKISRQWTYDNVCGSKYYGVHIAFEPVYNMGRLEYGSVRREVIRRNVILNRMWKNGVEDHKNVFFAFVHAAVPPDGLDVSSVVSTHVEQLEQFPQAPLVPVDVDLTGQYTEDPECSGLAQEAVDVGIRVVKDVMWQRHPWYLTGDAQPTHTLTGLDYMMAYWLGRYHGFIDKDDPVQCLRWH